MNEDNHHPDRKHPAHHAFVEGSNRTTILFLTVCTHHRKAILANESMHHALLEAWRAAEQWRVGRYVVMPDHIHLFCTPTHRESENIAKWVAYWKRLVSLKQPDLQPIWQRDCWDTQLRRHESYTEKWSYARNNPVRAGLVEHVDDWQFQGVVHHLPW